MKDRETHPPAGVQRGMTGPQNGLQILKVVQRHTRDNEVNAPVTKRQLLHILKGHRPPSVLERLLRPGNHLPGTINTQIAGTSLLQEHRTQSSVPTTKVKDV